MSVYPRECGGTDFNDSHGAEHQVAVYPRECGEPSPSPRPTTQPVERRSIPASAGEPPPWLGVGLMNPNGLSPRVRGNHRVPSLDRPPYVTRSIPASAGEPCRYGEDVPLDTPLVYPRECGGTRRDSPPVAANDTRSIPASAGEPPAKSTSANSPWRCGLSPRVRGNLRWDH